MPNIFLYPGETAPSTVRLKDPTVLTKGGADSISGAGILAVIFFTARFGLSLLSGGPGNQVATGFQTETHCGSSAISGNGSVASSGLKDGESAPGIAGGGSTAASGWRYSQSAPVISGNGTVSVTWNKWASGSLATSGDGDVVSSGQKSVERGAGIRGSGHLSSSGIALIHAGAGAISGNGPTTASGSKQTSAIVPILGNGSVNATGWKSVAGQSALSGKGAYMARGVRIKPRPFRSAVGVNPINSTSIITLDTKTIELRSWISPNPIRALSPTTIPN